VVGQCLAGMKAGNIRTLYTRTISLKREDEGSNGVRGFPVLRRSLLRRNAFSCWVFAFLMGSPHGSPL
jgi:hypothetical protein